MYRLRRSVLFVPGNNQKMVEKASRLRPDVVLIDCEDSVPEGEKEKARESLRSALTTHTWSSREVGVRVNAPDTPYFDEDLRVAVASGFELIAVPKVEGPEEVRLVERTLNELTRGKQLPSPKLLVMIETAKGVTFVDQILASSSLITAV
ncbi:MAG: CoA ester lyase, partial [Nitrososphaerota archaeon]|nr:CoA ester lyase [Nitrososphaerota archaeon]